MRIALLPAVLAAGLFVVPGGPPAAAEEPDFHLQGSRCSFAVAGGELDHDWTGEMDAGPLLLLDRADPTVPREGRVTCTIQIGGLTHSAPDHQAATATGTGVLVLPPTPITFQADPNDPSQFVYVCTRVDVTGGPTLYWHDFNNPYTGYWTTSPDAHCLGGPQALGPCCPLPLEDEIEWLLGGDVTRPWTHGFFEQHVDPVVCPYLATAFPPDGDFEVWECPPYGS